MIEHRIDEERLHAVLVEPQLKRFRDLCHLGDVPLTITFEGWSRHVILSSDRAFLFPRNSSCVAGLLREAEMLRALDGSGVPAPRLFDKWENPDISPYPFIAVSRLTGSTWSGLEANATLEQLSTVLAELGKAIALWHGLELRHIHQYVPERAERDDRGVAGFIDLRSIQEAAGWVAGRLDLSAQNVARWFRGLEPLASMLPVFVHGDIHESQIFVSDRFSVTGILDWESAGVGHPLVDFDFGNWGFGIFAWERKFDILRRVMWDAYVQARGVELPSWHAVHLLFCLKEISHFTRQPELDDWGQNRLNNNLSLVERLNAGATW